MMDWVFWSCRYCWSVLLVVVGVSVGRGSATDASGWGERRLNVRARRSEALAGRGLAGRKSLISSRLSKTALLLGCFGWPSNPLGGFSRGALGLS